jgi:hypothetical protein
MIIMVRPTIAVALMSGSRTRDLIAANTACGPAQDDDKAWGT